MSAFETSGPPENGGFRAHPRSVALAAALFCVLQGGPAAALKVRIGSGSRIEAHARLTSSPNGAPRVVVQGVLRDDFGAGLPNQHVALVFRGPPPNDSALPVPAPERCSEAADNGHEPHVAPDEYVVDTGPDGSFCLRATVPHATRVALAFEGAGLIEPTRADLSVQAAPPPALNFDPPPSVLHLDAATADLQASLAHVDVAPGAWVLRLRDERGNDLAEASVDVAGHARWEVPTGRLAGPGQGELIAFLEGAGAPPLSTRQRIERHARVEMDVIGGSPELAYREGTTVVMQVRASGEPVPGGFVEARAGERTLATSPVHDGRASWTIGELPLLGTSDVELHYWAHAPWWEPGAVRTIHISSGRHVAAGLRGTLIALAILVATWMLRGSYLPAFPRWVRRSRARDVASTNVSATGAAAVGETIVQVCDAHEGSPLSSALAEISIAAFPESVGPSPFAAVLDAQASVSPHVVWSQSADRHGIVHLPSLHSPPDALLRISSPLHVPLTVPIPRAGELTVRLVARRRHLLDRFARWAARELGPWPGQRDPTPHEAAQRARRSHLAPDAFEGWTEAVETAAFAAEPVDERREAAVLALEPTPTARSGSRHP